MACVCICSFFKRKTAYEMRISDWSSDVCSSDLWALGADGGHGHAQPPFRSSRLIGAERQPTSDCRQSLQQSPHADAADVADLYNRCSDYFLLQDGAAPTLDDARELFSDVPPEKKIGRATGRERGCRGG